MVLESEVIIMTWDELNKKYPEARDEMSTERERQFLKDLYNTYCSLRLTPTNNNLTRWRVG